MGWPPLVFTTVWTWGRSTSWMVVVLSGPDRRWYRAAPPAPAEPPARAQASRMAITLGALPRFLGGWGTGWVGKFWGAWGSGSVYPPKPPR